MCESEFDIACDQLAKLVARSNIRRKIVQMICQGKPRKEIAAQLGRSRHTVDAHLKEIYRQTGLADRVRLAVAAQRVCPS